MTSSPFRDDVAALQSMIEDLRRINEELAEDNARLRAEIEVLRSNSPENAAAFAHRLEEANAELRARVRELEPLRERVAYYEHRMRQPEVDPFESIAKVLRKLFRE